MTNGGPVDQRLWTQRTLALLAALFAWRTLMQCVTPLELCADEAYYWDWSRQLDWGYYSKPPMIAWIIAAATRVGGSSELAIRFPAVLLSTIGLWPVFRLASSQFDARIGFWTVVAVAATPGMAAMSLLMTIDAPFLCAWAFAVWCAWELLAPEEPEWRWVLPAIASTGLGLLSKQSMLAIFPLTGLWLILQSSERRKLLSPKVWTWWAGSLACLTPVLVWNAQHQWITVQHTGEHFQSKGATWARQVTWFAEFWGSHFGVISPLSCGLMIVLTIGGLLSWTQVDRRVRFLLCLGVVPMLGVTVLSATQRVQPNWPAGFVLTSFILLAAWGCGECSWRPLGAWSRRWFSAAVAVGACLTLGVYLVPLTVPNSTLAGGPMDPTVRLRGWESLSGQVGAELSSLREPDHPLLIAATGRGPVSLLAYYLPGQPRVYRWNPTGIVESQHEVWGGPKEDRRGADALIFTHVGQEVPRELAAAFATVERGTIKESHLGGRRWERLQVWRGSGYRGWPQISQSSAEFVQTADAAAATKMQ